MDPLEKYIISNREKFDPEEPDQGHFDRFLRKQESLRNRPSVFTWKYMLQAAAVTVLVVISTLWVYEKLTGTQENTVIIRLADISPEYGEAEMYYTSLINRKYNEIRTFDFRNGSGEHKMLLKELSEMDTIYKSLEKELNAERGNQMVINAMIRHYQLKLDIMNSILEHLYQVHNEEQLKTEDDDAIRI